MRTGWIKQIVIFYWENALKLKNNSWNWSKLLCSKKATDIQIEQQAKQGGCAKGRN